MINWRNIKRIRCILIIILLLVIILGVYLIYHSYQLNEYLTYPSDSQDYYINIISPEGENNLHLYHVSITQEFSDNQGSFSFALLDPANISHIQFNFPGKVDSSSFKCYYKNITYDIRNEIPFELLTCNVEKFYSNGSFLTFNKENFDSGTILINYSLNLIPMGLFMIETNQILYPAPFGSIILDLGKNYECVADCIYPWENVEIASRDDVAQTRILNCDILRPLKVFCFAKNPHFVRRTASLIN